MRIGYARVSTGEQRVDMQIEALKKANCDHIFTDEGISGATFSREGLDKVVAYLQRGDVLVVWRLDRIGRTLIGLVEFLAELGLRGVELCSLNENIDTSSSSGRLVFHMMAALAEFERSLISERTRAGLETARNKGIQLGRPPRISALQAQEIHHAVHTKQEKIQTLASKYNVSYRTIMRIIAKENEAVVSD
ncbi:recombinase family protein [Paenochrobactrum sp. BZR 588]|uniref:recombinase family protein n=1 Tax=Paenochrobactrum TaxID=999488 RepID=UPI0035BC9607